MEKANGDILLDENNEDLLVDGDLSLGDGTLDDCYLIFRLNKGGSTQYPMLGPNLQKMINSPARPTELKQELRLNLEMDGKDPNLINSMFEDIYDFDK